jgi:hypothetical protein
MTAMVTQGASFINLEKPTPTKRHHGWHRAGNLVSLNRLKWHFQSLRYALWWGLVARFPLLPTPPVVSNLFSRAFQQLKSIGSGECNPLENV